MRKDRMNMIQTSVRIIQAIYSFGNSLLYHILTACSCFQKWSSQHLQLLCSLLSMIRNNVRTPSRYVKRKRTRSVSSPRTKASIPTENPTTNWQHKNATKAIEKYRGVFEIQRSGDKTISGEIGLDIRTHASPKVGQDQVSGGVSVLCWHAAPVAYVQKLRLHDCGPT